jgi:rare lipoprotein A
MRSRVIAVFAVLFLAYACTTTAPPPQQPTIMHGIASWYGQEFAGRTTANGEIFDPLLLTAAHRTLPFGSVIDVKNSKSGQTVRVRVNDRGPFVGSRMIDLSYAAAQQIGLVDPGSGEVDVYLVQIGKGEREPPAPYVVTIPKSANTDREPPPVEVIVPVQAVAVIPPPPPPPTSTQAPPPADFSVSVVEEHRGVDTRRQVAADGRKIESVPVDGSKPAVAASAPGHSTAEAIDRTRVAPRDPVRKVAGTFFVQVGAFAVEANAKSLQQRLTQIGEQSHIDRDSLYRVRIGPFPTREQAIKARERLEASGMSAIIVGN